MFLLIWNSLILLHRDMPFLEQLKVSYWKIFLRILFTVWKYRVRNIKDGYHVSCSSSPEKSQHRHIYRNAWSWSLSCSLSTRLGKSVWVVSGIINFDTTEQVTLFTCLKKFNPDAWWRLAVNSGNVTSYISGPGCSKPDYINLGSARILISVFVTLISAKFSETSIVYPASILSLNNLTLYKT